MNRQSFTLADAFDHVGHGVDMTAPLPLGHHAAVQLAVKLRTENPSVWTYPTIADLMSRYHGVHRTVGWWWQHAREAGAPYTRPHAALILERNRCESASS